MIRRLAPLAAVAILAGCGGGATKSIPPRTPHLPHALATSWRSQADAVAAALVAGDGCTAQARAVSLRLSVIRAIVAKRVAPRFQEPLTAAVNDLASRVVCTPPPPAPVGHAGRGKHHGHGHGKHGKHGDD